MIDRFEPSMYPLAVNEFIIEHGGESPEIAFRNGLPHGATQADVFPIIDALYRYNEKAKHDGREYEPLAKVKASAQKFLQVHAQTEREKTRGGPAYPSMFSWDSRGKGISYGIGSDSGIVRTYFDEEGKRVQFGVDLIEKEAGYTPSWVKASSEKADRDSEYQDLIDDPENGVLTCPICKFSQNYRPDAQTSRNAARARLSRHLRRPQKDVEAHRALYGLIFGTTDVTR